VIIQVQLQMLLAVGEVEAVAVEVS